MRLLQIKAALLPTPHPIAVAVVDLIAATKSGVAAPKLTRVITLVTIIPTPPAIPVEQQNDQQCYKYFHLSSPWTRDLPEL